MGAVPACRQDVIDKLFRKSSTGRLKLESKKPVVLVLGTGWGAHSLVKVRPHHRVQQEWGPWVQQGQGP
jgi:hypothetical protein